MTIISDVAAILVANGHGTGLGKDIFGYRYEPSPDNQIVIIPHGGQEPIAFLGGDDIDRPGLQIQVRNASKTAAEAKAIAIRNLLKVKTDLPGYVLIKAARSHPVYWQEDKTNRHIFSIEFTVIQS